MKSNNDLDEQRDAAKPSVDRPILELCYLLGHS